MPARPTHRRRPRRFRVFTCDRGRRELDVDRDAASLVREVLQEVVNSAFWHELDRFPTDAIRRFLPQLDIPINTRRLLEIWIEERADGAAP